jgi:hypothetical protein
MPSAKGRSMKKAAQLLCLAYALSMTAWTAGCNSQPATPPADAENHDHDHEHHEGEGHHHHEGEGQEKPATTPGTDAPS